MAQDTLQRFKAGGMAKSVNVNTPDFQEDLQFDGDTINMTSGIHEGIGPRYGMAPIPGHSDQEAAAAGKFAGLMLYELGQQRGGAPIKNNRYGIFGIYPMRFGAAGASLKTKSTYYVMIVGIDTDMGNSGKYLDVLVVSTLAGGLQVQSANLFDGLPYTSVDLMSDEAGSSCLDGELLKQDLIASKLFDLQELTDLGTVKYISSVSFAISGGEIPMQWLVGQALTTGGVTTAPTMTLLAVSMTGLSNGGGAICPGGLPSSFNYGKFANGARSLNIYALDAQGNQNINYLTTLSFLDGSIYLPSYQDGVQNTNIDVGAGTTSKTTAGVTYANTKNALLNDPMLTCNSAFQGILSAANGKAICAVIQDWYQGEFGNLTQFIDMQSIPLAPVSKPSFYNEDGLVSKVTSFLKWPTFIRGTALSALYGVDLGAANSGILRANTVYEFTYSVFNKRLNFESNVGAPVKIQTGVNDFIGLQLFSTAAHAGANTLFSYSYTYALGQILPWPGTQSNFAPINNFTTGNQFHMNYLEYRFYYRLEGTQEWLPALFVDAPKFWFFPNWTPMMACTGGIGGLTGGSPGGFNDYSLLPVDTWTFVTMYKNRAFWLSDKSLNFSLANNLFAYSQRNSAACPVGAYKGATVHAYYGQALQDARLVVWGTASTYVGRFTGNLLQVPVQISADTVANFGLDGSDFVMDYWTSCTAFSYRAAVVAEGLLYFWGPQGIFMDDGVNPIKRVSIPLEPDLFNYYDPSATDSIKAIYNDTTKEIVWFFTPKTADAAFPTYGLVFNTLRGTWLPTKFAGQVDDAQLVKIESAAMPTAGARTVIYSRQSSAATIQRAQFFDQNNRAGDFLPGTELLVKQVSTPSAGVRRFTLAAGHPTLAGAVAAGDLIAIQQCARYATSMATPADLIGTVAAVNSGAGTIDVTLPDGVTFDAAISLASNNLYFPLYHATPTGNGLNGIPWILSTFYWIPAGLGFWGYWLYMWFVAKVALLPSTVAQALGFSYRTPISGGYSTPDELTLSDNSDGNWQRYRPLTVGNQNMEGQGIRFRLTGVQIGSEWVLQYVEAHANQLEGEQLRMFENEEG